MGDVQQKRAKHLLQLLSEHLAEGQHADSGSFVHSPSLGYSIELLFTHQLLECTSRP